MKQQQRYKKVTKSLTLQNFSRRWKHKYLNIYFTFKHDSHAGWINMFCNPWDVVPAIATWMQIFTTKILQERGPFYHRFSNNIWRKKSKLKKMLEFYIWDFTRSYKTKSHVTCKLFEHLCLNNRSLPFNIKLYIFQ